MTWPEPECAKMRELYAIFVALSIESSTGFDNFDPYCTFLWEAQLNKSTSARLINCKHFVNTFGDSKAFQDSGVHHCVDHAFASGWIAICPEEIMVHILDHNNPIEVLSIPPSYTPTH